MLKRKHIFFSVVIEACIIFLTGCGSSSISDPMETANISDTDSAENGMTEAENDTVALSEENQKEAQEELEKEPEQEESEDEADDTPKEAPQLPGTGGQLAISCRRTGSFWTAQSLILMRTASLIM